MCRRTLLRTATAGIAASLPGAPAHSAGITVTMTHVEQNKDIAAFWNGIARRHEAEHDGIKVDIRFMEAVSYVAKLAGAGGALRPALRCRG